MGNRQRGAIIYQSDLEPIVSIFIVEANFGTVLDKVCQVVVKEEGEKQFLVRNHFPGGSQGRIYQLINVIQRCDILTAVQSLQMLEKFFYY